MNLFFECVLFVAGLVFGSFLNVCISRIPRDESVVRPPSHCRQCGRPIRWRDNVPVLSFLSLRGRCRDCGLRIPYRYPLVELLAGFVFFGCYVWFGASWVTLKFCVFGFLLIGLIFMDAETGLLPHEFTYTGTALGLAFAWVAPGDSTGTELILRAFHRQIGNPRALSLLDSVIGAAVGAGFFYLAWALYYLVRKRHGLGFGDIALMAMTGAFLGLKLNLFVIACAPVITLVCVLIMQGWESAWRASESGDRGNSEIRNALITGSSAAQEAPFLQREIPFGVFLGVCSLVAIFFGEAAWAWYLTRF